MISASTVPCSCVVSLAKAAAFADVNNTSGRKSILRATSGWIARRVVSDRLGHATVAFTLDRYSHVIPALEEAAAETVAALVFGAG